MTSLRARIAAVLLASIALVVCLATVVAVLVGHRQAGRHFFDPSVRQFEYLASLSLANPADTKGLLQDAPAPGRRLSAPAEHLRAGLERAGKTWAVVVTQDGDERHLFASVEVAPARWLVLPIPRDAPPPDAWIVMTAWMLLILCGTAAVSLVVAYRVTRPLVLLESVASSIDAGGQLGPVPESGPAEVRVTARALNRLSSNLRQAAESRMRLVAAAGHDLRTPLTRMRLRAEFLDEGERASWLRNIEELERIADSAIALVREETAAPNDEAIRLDLMARSIADDLKTLKLPVTIKGTTPVSICGPSLALTRAFRNLATNAATHGGGAELVVEERGGRAVFTVLDSGPGIPEALIERVFEPFFRVDQSRRQSIPGAGLGLAIAREIIGRAKGELVLENRPSGGLSQVAAFPVAA